MSVSLDTITISCVVLTKADNLNNNLSSLVRGSAYYVSRREGACSQIERELIHFGNL